MATAFSQFLKKQINLAPVGVERVTDPTTYFCTPKGASIIGQAGVDGIHYCFIRGFGEMVFAVSPMNTAPDYVHPLAENFTNFLRLLLACGDAAALEQAWMWDKAQFEIFLKENPATEEQERTLAEIAEKMKLTAMEQPWEYIKSLQASFDYSKIKYTEDYFEIVMNPEAEPTAPEWKTYFDGNFWGHQGKDHAGKEIPIGKQFEWAGHRWLIPAAYSCSKGLVVDLCMRVEPETIRAFMRKWNLSWENDSCAHFTREQRMEMDWDNPLCFDFRPELELNGRKLRASHGCAVSYNPCLPDGMVSEFEAKWAVDHYGLDADYGWAICREAFPWGTKHRPKIKTLSLTMEQQPVPIPGPHFKVCASGDTVAFTDPADGKKYILTVQEVEQQTLPERSFGPDCWEYPAHCCVMSYTISPEIADGKLTVMDSVESDRPKEKEHLFHTPTATSSVTAVGIIGGADGPAAIAYGTTDEQVKPCVACSALHFAPVTDVEWRMVFYEKQFKGFYIELIQEGHSRMW